MNVVAMIGVVFVVWLGAGLLVARCAGINKQKDDEDEPDHQ